MPNDDLIAALEEVVGFVLDEAKEQIDWKFFAAAERNHNRARLIRALIADLRAGRLVRREDVADERAEMSRVVGAATVVGEKNGAEQERAKMIAQLRSLKDQSPPESLWSAASILAHRYEQFGNFLSHARQPQQAIAAGAHE